MVGEYQNRWGWMAGLGLCCAGMAATSAAAPPFSVSPAGHAGVAFSGRLDLRPPAEKAFAGLKGSGGIFSSTANGSFAANGAPLRSAVSAEDKLEQQERWGGLAAGASPPRPMGRSEALVQRFRREGVPLARLWESHSALLSLGLNQKGRPGLWLMQKTH